MCVDSYQVYRASRNTLDVFGFLDELVLDCHSDINFGELAAQNLNMLGHGALPANGEDLAQPAEPEPADNQDDGEDAHQQVDVIPPPRMSYRRLRLKLPHTLRTLKVYNSHVPDIYFIQQVATECPMLRSLTLARCTIFTCAQCEFWKRLPRSESDAYFSNQGVIAYAVSHSLAHHNRMQLLTGHTLIQSQPLGRS